jgi:hypothetical protein
LIERIRAQVQEIAAVLSRQQARNHGRCGKRRSVSSGFGTRSSRQTTAHHTRKLPATGCRQV